LPTTRLCKEESRSVVSRAAESLLSVDYERSTQQARAWFQQAVFDEGGCPCHRCERIYRFGGSPQAGGIRLFGAGTGARHIAGLDLEFCEGDLLDEASIKRAMQDVQYVFHIAADYRLWARHRDEIFATNVGGTRTVMREALRADVARVVYTSTVATIALTADGSPADETRRMPEEERLLGGAGMSVIAARKTPRVGVLWHAGSAEEEAIYHAGKLDRRHRDEVVWMGVIGLSRTNGCR
jgi:3-beta hydroxysteroid dehydrogenase/isomerase family